MKYTLYVYIYWIALICILTRMAKNVTKFYIVAYKYLLQTYRYIHNMGLSRYYVKFKIPVNKDIIASINYRY